MAEWEGTEGESLSEWLEGFEQEEEDGEIVFPEQSEKSRKFKSSYDRNKSLKVGAKINCPVCGKESIKTTYHKIFCGRPRCKDMYWNTVDVKRRERAKRFK
jgi:hypothetical protein